MGGVRVCAPEWSGDLLGLKIHLEVCVCGGGGGGGRAGKQKVYIGWLYGQQGNGAGGACFRKLIIISK